ncbi:DNA-3-methyladenine glycosylase I [gamma proteobacterium HdN1]|nr:DNA-3-methyladenine glycosylase I [gamma proteobacterium HdN1]
MNIIDHTPQPQRCQWAQGKPQFYLDYHDHEWGVPVHDERKHFEMLILEGAQAGLSWETILKRREAYRSVYHNFEPARIAAMADTELEALLQNPAIIRNRRKVFAARQNAQIFLQIQQEFGSFDQFIWNFVHHKPIVNHWQRHDQVPITTPESDALAKALKKRGMAFVGSTILYAHMQAIGMVNDHLVGCFRYKQV